MMRKNYSLILIFLGITLCSFSQHTYSLELNSYNGKHPKEVLDDISQHFDNYNRHITDEVIVFESKVPISNEKMTEIVEVSGYTIKEFKLVSTKEEELQKEQEVK